MDRRQKIWLAVLAGYVMLMYSQSMLPSAQSSAESGRVLQIARDVFDLAGVPSAWLTEHIVRKTAHFTEYAGMGFLLYQNLRGMGGGQGFRRLAGAAAVLGIPFADETIQLFVEGRSGMIQDVWLDMAGAVFGLTAAALLAAGWARIRRKR